MTATAILSNDADESLPSLTAGSGSVR
jgi:hypothetical protein